MRTWRPPNLAGETLGTRTTGVCKRSRGERGKEGLRHLEDGLRQRPDRPEAVGHAPLPDPPTDDPNYVMVDLEFDSETEADGLSSGLSGNVNLGGLSPGFPRVEARVVGVQGSPL